jgi:hypothetical protein
LEGGLFDFDTAVTQTRNNSSEKTIGFNTFIIRLDKKK